MPGKPGSGGPPPKRQEQRRRRNTDVVPVTTAPSGGTTNAPASEDVWHPRAREWFDSLGRSGQSRFYEASDWAMAKIAADMMTKLLEADKPSAQLLASVLQLTTALMTTEGDRRRLRLELSRATEVDEDEAASVAALDDYRKRLGGG